MTNSDAIQYFNHMARCMVLGVVPMTWEQFVRFVARTKETPDQPGRKSVT